MTVGFVAGWGGVVPTKYTLPETNGGQNVLVLNRWKHVKCPNKLFHWHDARFWVQPQFHTVFGGPKNLFKVDLSSNFVGKNTSTKTIPKAKVVSITSHGFPGFSPTWSNNIGWTTLVWPVHRGWNVYWVFPLTAGLNNQCHRVSFWLKILQHLGFHVGIYYLI